MSGENTALYDDILPKASLYIPSPNQCARPGIRKGNDVNLLPHLFFDWVAGAAQYLDFNLASETL